MTTQTVVLINDYGSGSLERRIRTSNSGNISNRWSVTLDAKLLALNFDTKTLGRPVAQAITAHLQRRVSEISAPASASTQLQRKYATNALAQGKTWATKRYTGGRIGAMSPNQSERLFNDSGRLVKGITANPTRDNNWVINVPANRLNATQLGSEAALKDLIYRLRLRVPEFASAEGTLAQPEVKRALEAAVKNIVLKQPGAGKSRLGELGKELIKIAIQEIARGDS